MNRHWTPASESITAEVEHYPVFNIFQDILNSAPYIKDWSEYSQTETKGDESLIYRLEFADSLQPNDQVFSSVADHLANSKLNIIITEQTSEGVIVEIPRLERVTIGFWFLDKYNEERNDLWKN